MVVMKYIKWREEVLEEKLMKMKMMKRRKIGGKWNEILVMNEKWRRKMIEEEKLEEEENDSINEEEKLMIMEENY